MCNSFKMELFCGAHCFLPTYTPAASAGTSGQNTLTGLTSVGAGTYAAPTFSIVPGMTVTGTGIGAGACVGKIISQTSVSVDIANSGTVTSGSVAFAGDVFKILLIKSTSPAGTYDATLTNVGTPNNSTGGAPSVTNVGTDEVAASGTYAAGGQALASNVMPGLSSGVATTSWTVNPSWTGATISTVAAVIYNTATRMGAPANGITANASGSAINRAVSVHDFGGTQSVTSGTLTLTLPSNTNTTAILRIA
jgi:hypothetical protein